MKKDTFALIAAIGMLVCSCGSKGSSDAACQAESADSLNSNVFTNEYGIKCYNSAPEAVAAMNSEPLKKSTEGPVSLADLITNDMEPVDHLEIGAGEDLNMPGTYMYTIGFRNMLPDECVAIESVLLPDSYFTPEWTWKSEIPITGVCFLRLRTKKPLANKYFPVIITYRDNKYPPQTFSITLQPDQLKLIQERGY